MLRIWPVGATPITPITPTKTADVARSMEHLAVSMTYCIHRTPETCGALRAQSIVQCTIDGRSKARTTEASGLLSLPANALTEREAPCLAIVVPQCQLHDHRHYEC